MPPTRSRSPRALAPRARSLRAAAATAALALSILLAACGAAASSPASPATAASPGASVPPVVRAVLAAGQPSAAPGNNLELVRYTIQPGTKLVAHHHPGMQLALIESGTLTYTVIEGTVTVHQADGGTRTIGAGETGKIAPGEWIAEDETVVHFGANEGTEPVVILASSLLDAAEKPAIPVESPSATP